MIAALLASALAAASDEPQNAVSLEASGLLWNGVQLLGERKVHPNVSALVGLGVRFTSATTVDAAVGVRFWPNRFRLLTDLGGPQLGTRVDLAWSKIAPRGRDSFSLAWSLRAGYRFVLFRRVEITPEAGLAISMGFDQAPWLVVVPRPGAVFALTVGYLF